MSPSGIRRKMRSPWDLRWSVLIHLFIQHSLRTCACQAPLSTGNMNSYPLRKTDKNTETPVLTGKIQSLEVEGGGSLYQDWETTRVEAGITSLLCAAETRVVGMSHKNHILGDMVGKATGKNETHHPLLGRVRASLLYVLSSWTDFWLLVSLLVDFSDIPGGKCNIAYRSGTMSYFILIPQHIA